MAQVSNNMLIGLDDMEAGSPFVEGLIRFAWEGDASAPQQKGVFELLTHVHAATPEDGQIPRMQTHPLADKAEAMDSESEDNRRHLMEVPIRILGKRVEDVIKAGYRAYDVDGRLVCHASSDTAVRSDGAGQKSCVACPGSASCEFGKQFQCQLHVRMHIAVQGSEDPYAVFEFQTTSVNSYRALRSKLQMFHAMLDGDLSGLPLRLTSWQKSTRGSGYRAFHCANLELPTGQTITDAAAEAVKLRAEMRLDRLGSVMEAWAGNEAVDINIVRPERVHGIAVVASTPKSYGGSTGIEKLVAAAKRDVTASEIAPQPVDNLPARKIQTEPIEHPEPMGI